MLNQNQIQSISDLMLQVGEFQLEQQKFLSTIKVEEKSPGQLVSYVDTESEKMLVSGLLEITPSAGFLTEEETTTIKNEELYWIIDPVDGTTNYLFGHTKFSISIALYSDGKPVYANVYIPADKEMFVATPEGAFLNGTQFRVSTRANLNDTLIGTGFPYYKFDEMDGYLEVLKVLMKQTKGLRRMGSAAIDLVYTACGRFDAYFELNLSPWDVAGGAYIVQQAGGTVTSFTSDPDYIFGNSILAGNPEIHEKLLTLLNEQNF